MALLPAGPSKADSDDIAAHRNRQLAAAATLDELSAAERGELLSALHPGLGPALARWWSDGQERPYQRGWSRKAFRILGSPQVTRHGRLDELTQLLRLTGPYDADPAWLAIIPVGSQHRGRLFAKVTAARRVAGRDRGSSRGEHPANRRTIATK
jgi:hypothetical protein